MPSIQIDSVPPSTVDAEEYAVAANAAFAGRRTTPEEVQWKLSNNGFGVPLLLTARSRLGNLLGLLAFGSGRLSFGNKQLAARLSYDTFVVPNARGAGLFRRMLDRANDVMRGTDAAFNFPNRASQAGFCKAGWKPLVKIPQRSTVVLRRKPGAVSSATPEDIRASLSASEISASQAVVRWLSSVEHIEWRLANPVGESYLLESNGVVALVSVQRRRGLREMRVVSAWRTGVDAVVSVELVRMGAAIGCRLATCVPNGLWGTSALMPVVHGWVPRPSNAELFVWKGSRRGITGADWRLSGEAFHTW